MKKREVPSRELSQSNSIFHCNVRLGGMLTAQNNSNQQGSNQTQNEMPVDFHTKATTVFAIRIFPPPPFYTLAHYLNLAVQRPMTSPWQTSSALNSDPSSVR
jgi:hypothetical protein